MNMKRLACCLIAWALAGPASFGQQPAPKVPPELKADPPVLRLEAGGPTAAVNALAFSPDGGMLYAAGFDKVVRTWRLDKDGRFAGPGPAYRVPVGPGTSGVINCLAVSPDGKWLAVGGLGAVRDESPYRDRYADTGRIFLVRWPESEEDRGTIYLFPTEPAGGGPPPAPRLLIGHRGPVFALAFAPEPGGTVLLSAAREPGAASSVSKGRVIAWQVPGGNKVGELPLGELRPDVIAPALAVRRTGAGPEQVRAAIAWGDGHLRLWDVIDKEPRAFNDGAPPANKTAVYTSGSQIVTGGYTRAKGGYLHFWEDGAGPIIKPTALESLPVGDYASMQAVRLAAVPASRRDHLAAVLAIEPKDGRVFYNLGLYSLADRKFVSSASLWDAAGVDPVLAASPDGRYVAVAGGGQPTVRVYAVADLLLKPQKPQTLRSVGVPVRRVAFAAAKGVPEPGLVLGLSAPDKPLGPARLTAEDLVFDFVNRTLTRGPAENGWGLATAAEDGWQVTASARPKPGESWLIDWRGPQGRRQQSALALDPAEVVTAAAVVPDVKDVTAAPLLAVAIWDRDRNHLRLALYDTRPPTPGDPLNEVRRLTGHVQPIRSLAVTRDGKYLASAADDQTVNLWSLRDLDKIIGQRGALAGVMLRDRRNDLVVDQKVPLSSPAHGHLELDDVITSLTFKKNDPKPRTGLTAFEFCDALWRAGPGKTFWVEVRRGNGPQLKVQLETGQGVDERKPLLSLFLAESGGREPEWVAWTPSGPYDASSAKVEEYVGWHFNPKQRGDPVKFAPLKDYSRNFYEPKLLPPLLTYGKLDDALQEINKIPAPKVEIFVPRGRAADADPVVVRDPSVPVVVHIDGPSIAKGQVGSVGLEVDSRKRPLDLATAEGQDLRTNMELEARIKRTVRVTVTTTDGQTDTAELQLVFVPPAPTVRLLNLPPKAEAVGKNVYPLHAQVVRGRAGEEVIVRLFRLRGNKPTPLQFAPGEIAAVPGKDLLDIKKNLDLQPGENTFRLEAVNADAPDEPKAAAAAETDGATFTLKYEMPETPTVVFTEVQLIAGKGPARRMTVEPGQPLVVHRPRVRLRGGVTAKADLALVELRGEGDKPVAFTPHGKTYDLDREEGPLEPGREYKLTLAAKTTTSNEGTATLILEYQPEPAGLRLDAPDDGEVIAEGRGRAGPPLVDVRGRFDLPDDFQPFEVELRVVNGKGTVPQKGNQEKLVTPFAKREEAGEGKSVLLGSVRLARGRNRVQVQVRTEWGPGPLLERSVSFVRRPLIVNAKGVLVGQKLVVHTEITAPAEAPLDRVVIGGRRYDLADPTWKTFKTTTDARQITTWDLEREMEYPQGTTSLALVAGNADGQDEKAVMVPPPPLPDDLKDVTLTGLDRVREPSCGVHVVVTSLSPLERIEVSRNGKVVQVLDVKKQSDADDPGVVWTFQDDIVVDELVPGVNVLRLEAFNKASKKHVDRLVTYVVLPLSLVVNKPDGPQDSARYELTGAVYCEEDAGQEKQVEDNWKHLRVYVNGFRQRPPAPPERVRGRSADGRRFNIKVPLLLNGTENEVVVHCPGLPAERLPPPFTIRCRNPEKPGRLHLLIVNAGKTKVEDQVLVERALTALQLQGRQGPELRSDVFREVIPYPDPMTREIQPLTGYVGARQPNIRMWLQIMREAVRSKDSSPSDVTLIYWLGEEVADEKGDWYLATANTNPQARVSKSGVRLEELLAADDDGVVGARVVLLDVVSARRSGRQRGFDFSRSDAAVLRYPWAEEEVPVPGLLLTLENAGRKEQVVTLEKLARAAKDKDVGGDPKLSAAAHILEPLLHLAGLEQLLVAGKPPAKPR
jgi:WD40 repeat protein